MGTGEIARERRSIGGLVAFIVLMSIFWAEVVFVNFKMIPEFVSIISDMDKELSPLQTGMVQVQHIMVSWYGMVMSAGAIVLTGYGGIQVWLKQPTSFRWLLIAAALVVVFYISFTYTIFVWNLFGSGLMAI